MMSLHYRGTCTQVKDIKCIGVDTETHRRKSQPVLVVRGFASSVKFEKDVALIKY